MIHALTLRLLALDVRGDDGFALRNSLSHPRLHRVVERMEADLGTDLDLKTLAVESGYSISHFLRMFQAAMGCTPFRYVSQLRVKRAQAMMSNKNMRLIDVALECWFFESLPAFTRVSTDHWRDSERISTQHIVSCLPRKHTSTSVTTLNSLKVLVERRPTAYQSSD